MTGDEESDESTDSENASGVTAGGSDEAAGQSADNASDGDAAADDDDAGNTSDGDAAADDDDADIGEGSDDSPDDASLDASDTSAEHLAPSIYDVSDADAKGFAPKLPWRMLGLGAIVIISVIGGYLYNEEAHTSALRESIVGEYAAGVEPDARRLRGFRQRLEELVIASAAAPPETQVDASLRFAAMHDAHGVYLRIRAANAGTPEDIARGSSRMMPDALTRCLGIAPTSLRGLFERGAFLDTSWPERLRDAHTRLRLRVIQDELRRHITRDLPLYTELLEADYFLLVLEQDDGAFDVFMWDLHHGTELLRTRARPSGLLIPVRVNLPGIPNGPRPRALPHPVGAAECSIAGQIKALTHEDTMTFRSHMPVSIPTVRPADAGTGDAAAMSPTAMSPTAMSPTAMSPTAMDAAVGEALTAADEAPDPETNLPH